MYQKLNWLFMVFWIAGIIAMSVFQQLWLMKYMVILFVIFWAWGFFRTLYYQLTKRRRNENVVENEMNRGKVEKEKQKKPLEKERNSIFQGLFDRPDDRFKR